MPVAVQVCILLYSVQIQELQKEYGGSGEGSEPIKPLAHILLEAKQAKDEAFQNQWKQMKQGMSQSAFVFVHNLLCHYQMPAPCCPKSVVIRLCDYRLSPHN